MTRGAAISMALLAIIVLALIVLLAWPTHSASAVTAAHSVGDRLLNVACAMLRNGTQFNPSLESQKVIAKG